MTVDYLIIGQGISGTMLSWFLHKEGKTFVVMDEPNQQAPSRVAAGIINPVTGRRYAYSWMIDDVMPFAQITYESMEKELDTSFSFKKDIIDFFPSPDARNVFVKKILLNDTYLHSYPDQNHFNQHFNYDFGCGEIKPAYTVHLSLLLQAWRKKLQDMNALIEQRFQAEELKVKHDEVRYGDVRAGKIIFCDGPFGSDLPWFRLLPFALNKGEAIVIRCEDITNNHVYKRSYTMAPAAENGTFWVGSSYIWDYTDNHPTEQFLHQTTAHLKKWLKVPFEVLDHKAAIRPATVERRPFVGLHPHLPSLGILNGMGTKGTSLAPYFANQLAQHLVHAFPIADEANVQRFSRILAK